MKIFLSDRSSTLMKWCYGIAVISFILFVIKTAAGGHMFFHAKYETTYAAYFTEIVYMFLFGNLSIIFSFLGSIIICLRKDISDTMKTIE